MNKNIKKLAILALAGLTLCGTAVAAPHGHGRRGPRCAPIHHRAPQPPRHHHHHHDTGLVLGATVIGGIIGGIVGAICD